MPSSQPLSGGAVPFFPWSPLLCLKAQPAVLQPDGRGGAGGVGGGADRLYEEGDDSSDDRLAGSSATVPQLPTDVHAPRSDKRTMSFDDRAAFCFEDAQWGHASMPLSPMRNVPSPPIEDNYYHGHTDCHYQCGGAPPLLRSRSFLDGLSASISRSLEFGCEHAPRTEIYSHLYASARGDENATYGSVPNESEDDTMMNSSNNNSNNTAGNYYYSTGSNKNSNVGNKSSRSYSSLSLCGDEVETKVAKRDAAYDQAQLLLVSLLENFCSLYDRDPEKNTRLFTLVCRQLWNMGILTSADFFVKTEKLRGVYREAFRTLVLQAIQGIEIDEIMGDPHHDIHKSVVESEERHHSQAGSGRTAPIDWGDDRARTSPSRESLVDYSAAAVTAFGRYEDNTAAIGSLSIDFEDLSLDPHSSTMTTTTMTRRTFDEDWSGSVGGAAKASRLESEFNNLQPIGHGGFAKVFKADHAIDYRSYAFKRIEFASKASDRYGKILREIKSLAHLDHHHIVRYHGAWVEEKRILDTKRGSSADYSKAYTAGNGMYPRQPLLIESGSDKRKVAAGGVAEYDRNGTSPLSARSPGIVIPLGGNAAAQFEVEPPGYYMIIQMELCQFTLSDWLEQRNHLITQSTQWTPETARKTSSRHRRRSDVFIIPPEKMASPSAARGASGGGGEAGERPGDRAAKGKWTVLHSENCRIFRSIVEALHYIHTNGIIHRDLKPGNIFFQVQNGSAYIPKIGDFGLASDRAHESMALSDAGASHAHSGGEDSGDAGAGGGPGAAGGGGKGLCSSDRHEEGGELEDDKSSRAKGGHARTDSSKTCSPSSMTHTMGLGTCMYAAPEQIRDTNYNEKVDIYSLGIIMFELFYPFATRMERHNVLEDLKNGIIPPAFMKQWPKEATFIWSCISPNDAMRPSAEQILASDLFQCEHGAGYGYGVGGEGSPHEEGLRRDAIERLARENDDLKRLLDEEKAKGRLLAESLRAFEK